MAAQQLPTLARMGGPYAGPYDAEAKALVLGQHIPNTRRVLAKRSTHCNTEKDICSIDIFFGTHDAASLYGSIGHSVKSVHLPFFKEAFARLL